MTTTSGPATTLIVASDESPGDGVTGTVSHRPPDLARGQRKPTGPGWEAGRLLQKGIDLKIEGDKVGPG
uniref:Uncharacterized protein n=1 Tax=Caulobacter phage BL57 TaxID=3348355 RepID=A0AB74UL11_9VIRU